MGPSRTPTVHPCPACWGGRGWLIDNTTNTTSVASPTCCLNMVAERNTTTAPRSSPPRLTEPSASDGRPTQELAGYDPRTDDRPIRCLRGEQITACTRVGGRRHARRREEHRQQHPCECGLPCETNHRAREPNLSKFLNDSAKTR